MPQLSVWFVRASLIFLLVGFTFGALILAQKGISYNPSVWNLFYIHVEFLLIGWLVQLAMGVAFWILPRYKRGRPRGNENLIWVAFVSVNIGVLLAALQLWNPLLFLTGRVFEALGVVTFIVGSWQRVKPFGL